VVQIVLWIVDSSCSKHMTGARESNLYTIFISDMDASSPVCLMSKATSTKSWLWHQRLSHLNFGTINDLTKHDLVDGLPEFKYECWPITKAQATRVEVAELRMLRWICDKTMIDMIPNGVFRADLDVDSIVDKMREGRLRWFGHVKRRPRNASVRRVEAMEVEGSRRRGRPKLRWEDRLKMDMKELLLSEETTEYLG
nr:putative cytochrome P450 [Tanacetum cinerariifolium]